MIKTREYTWGKSWRKKIVNEVKTDKIPPAPRTKLTIGEGTRGKWDNAVLVCGPCRSWTEHEYDRVGIQSHILYRCCSCGARRNWGSLKD